MGKERLMTPNKLFAEFRKSKLDFGWMYGYKAMDKFRSIEDKSTFVIPTIEFMKQEQEDQVRSWGTAVLETVGGEEAFSFLVSVMKNYTQDKKKYRYTRFFALKGIAKLANSDTEKKDLLTLLQDMWNKGGEDYLAEGLVSILLTLMVEASTDLKQKAEVKLKDMLNRDRIDEYWPALRVLRGLREFGVPELTDDILMILRLSPFHDHKRYAIKALALPDGDINVVRELGLVLRMNPDSSLRLEAVKSLATLEHPDSQEDLTSALSDDDAEVRVQSSKALKSLLKDRTIPSVVERILREGVEQLSFSYLIDAIRFIDPERVLSTQVLSKELSSEDQRRAKLAEKILLELGGWAAVQKISQRRSTLENLDKLLAESEQAVKDTFHDTINQARRNFYFAMGVNIIIVVVGLILISIAINQLMQRPEKLEAWIVPGAAGLFGIMVTMFFNNPRQNAREDLTSLMNVNVIFLGFLRRLNQIDATFKYAFIENRSFGAADMEQTVKQIDNAVLHTLKMAEEYLRNQKSVSKVETKTPSESGK